MTEVLPCPCCGSEARICQWRDTLDPMATWVECTECGIATDTFHHEDREEATAMAAAVWNRRVDVNVNK